MLHLQVLFQSEVVITCVVIILIANVAIFVAFLIIIRFFVVRFEATLSLVLSLSSEACLGFTHFIELRIIVLAIILKDLILLILQVLVLQFLDHLLLLCASLTVLQVVHVQLVLQVVDISVLLNVCTIETLQFSLEPLVLLLELWLDILDALEALVCALKLNSSALDGVLEDGLVSTQ